MFFSRYGCIVSALAAMAAVSLWANTAQTTESDPVDQGVPGQPQPNTDVEQPSDVHPPKSPLRLSTIDYQDAGDKPGKLTVGGVARTCGQMPLSRAADGYYYFSATAGQFPWAGLYTY